MPLSLALLLLASASSNSTAPAEVTTSKPTAVIAAKPVKPKKICKGIAVTGSRLGKRECKTQEQWEQGESTMELGQKSGRGNLTPANPLGKQSI